MLARAVVRRPLIWGGVAAAVLLALAAPVHFALNLEDRGASARCHPMCRWSAA